MGPEQINCRRCRHYAVTWDPACPHGCRAFGFKSAQIPSAQVLANSGMACRMFEPKDKTPDKPPKKKTVVA